jgi:protein ImuB
VDGKVEQVQIGTNRASHHVEHLFKLFELKIATIEPALGIELFVLDAPKVDDADPVQERLWGEVGGLDDTGVAELLDRIAGKINTNVIHRYLPDEHYWPERSIKKAAAILEKPATAWRISRPRPTQLLARPEPVQVMSLVPDYPPMHFIYKGKVHQIKKADGPERIEREWWLENGERRDYYHVEDTDGKRYWIFRLGKYMEGEINEWFIHGFFA